MNESNVFGISIRAYIVVMLVTTFVILNFLGKDVDSTFSTLVVAVVTFYFGNKTPTPSQSTSDDSSPIVAPKAPIQEVKL